MSLFFSDVCVFSFFSLFFLLCLFNLCYLFAFMNSVCELLIFFLQSLYLSLSLSISLYLSLSLSVSLCISLSLSLILSVSLSLSISLCLSLCLSYPHYMLIIVSKFEIGTLYCIEFRNRKLNFFVLYRISI